MMNSSKKYYSKYCRQTYGLYPLLGDPFGDSNQNHIRQQYQQYAN